MRACARTTKRRVGRGGSVTLALQPLAQQLAIAANGFGLLPRPPLRGFLVIASQLHFSEHPLALHFFLQGSQSLIDIIVANEDLHGGVSPIDGCACGGWPQPAEPHKI